MVLYDFRFPMMRTFSLFAHILFTTVLYWTKFDSIQIGMVHRSDDSEYKSANESFTGLLSVSLIFLLIKMVYLGMETQVTLSTVMHLFLDVAACLFISWIFLDGLVWETYIYVFAFCR
jgi:Transmembrane protein